MHRPTPWLLLWLSLAVCLASESLPAAAPFRVGCAMAEITPPVGWRRAGGFLELLSTGVHDPLYAKALVLSQGDTSLALVSNDLCSVPRELTGAARRLAGQKTGIPAANIIIVLSLANDLDFYIPTRRAFEEGHYESTACPLEPGCGERLVEAALRLLGELKSH